MKLYKPKSLIDGFKLGDKYKGKTYVAVPQLRVEKGYSVAINNEIMSLAGKEPVLRKEFKDQYGRQPYWLYYYEWKPEKLTIAGNL